MKRVILVLAVLVFAALADYVPNAHAQQETDLQGVGPYVGGHLGLNAPSDSDIGGGVISAEHDPLIGFGGVLGYDFGNIRVDGEIAIRLNTTDSLGGVPLGSDGLFADNFSSTFAFSYMVNGYFDIPTGGPLKPFIGGGIGFATVSIDWVTPGIFPFSEVTLADDNDSGLAYQFSGGFGYEINERTTISVSYRYFETEELQMQFVDGSPFAMDYQSHEFNIGARILFH